MHVCRSGNAHRVASYKHNCAHFSQTRSLGAFEGDAHPQSRSSQPRSARFTFHALQHPIPIYRKYSLARLCPLLLLTGLQEKGYEPDQDESVSLRRRLILCAALVYLVLSVFLVVRQRDALFDGMFNAVYSTPEIKEACM